ncbi:hypothetical protein [Solibacillus sp. FSL K6-1126]|uniref:hypothetical protein n=1 Tax=Solibacillus sp. FSL K6-1126 TaxID=2921463 RepID=UPI0030FA7372
MSVDFEVRKTLSNLIIESSKSPEDEVLTVSKEKQMAFQSVRDVINLVAYQKKTAILNLTNCPCCHHLTECIYEFEGNFYCSDECVKETVLVNKVSALCEYTGLSIDEVKLTIDKNKWTLDTLAWQIDIYNSAKYQGSYVPTATITAFKNAGIYDKLYTNLAKYNTFQSVRDVINSVAHQKKTAKSNLTNCPCCHHLTECIYEFEGNFYCSGECVKETMILVNKVSTLCRYTGLSIDEVKLTIDKNSWTLDAFAEHIDIYNSSKYQGSYVPTATITAFKNAGIYDKLYTNLAKYNTMRGGTGGFKGFVFEELHAAKATISGTPTKVLSNNSIADFLIINSDGTKVLGQAKAGYKNTYIDFTKYQGQTMVVDKGNTQLIQRAKSAGLELIESDVSLNQTTRLADIMKLESKILGTSNAKITSKIYSLNQAGLSSARTGGAAGAGFSIGTNIVEVFSGDKDLSEAGVAITRDTAVATASSYAIGALASTSVGAVVTGTVATAATTVGTAIGSTAIGSSIMVGAGTIAGVATTATAAATTAATGVVTAAATAAAGTAIGSTAVGGAAIAGAVAVGSAAVAAAPIVIGAAAVGGAFALGKKILGR